ncbi:class I SAM-dependent methyltransferase [Aeromicrobium wangtongii]|uniref:class I SAM-dependent methyltransferase n=1 Tax=Aeromicrobium wangtongii TaxID=2969247 RepID=UPI002017142B|nr:class I SAM-dependent methyltransferase [Aeromicrobium wangtongii]MCL3818666.1 methyltransferase domain-containing protein [Aeromicrobium wangtongii]
MDDEQAELWNHAVGDAWVRHVDQFDATLAPFGQAAVDVLAPADGERILDIGCGVGTTTLQLSTMVGGGEVVGVDISAPMLTEARRRADARGLRNVHLFEADAQTADLGDSTFDAVFSRFGVMFFTDPPAAFAHLAAALVPGGRLSFVCFAAPGANPFILLPVMAAAAHLDLSPPSPDGPGPFSLADPDRTVTLLREAGFDDVVSAPGPDEAILHGADDLDALAERVLEQNPATGTRLAVVEPSVRAAAVQATAQALAPHRTGDRIRLGAGSWIVSATRR